MRDNAEQQHTISSLDLQARLNLAVLSLLVLMPWINPFAGGPSPGVHPWLFSMACAAMACLWFAGERLQPVADKGRWIDAVVMGWVLAGLISAAMGLLQYSGRSGALAPWVSPTGIGEAFGNLRQRNQFATLTNIALAAVLWGLARGARRVPVALALALATLLAMGNAVSSSRTGMAQLVMLVLLALLWGGWRDRLVRAVLGWSVLVYGLSLVLMPWATGLDMLDHGLTGRLRAGDAVCSSRVTLWRNVLYLIGQKPWLGWGWGELDYAHYITLYPGARFCDILDNAHNLPLHLAVELGVPAAVLICGTLLVLFWRARPWAEQQNTRRLAWAVLGLMGLHSMLEYPLWYGPFQMAAGFAVAMLVPVRQDRAEAVGAVAWRLAAAGLLGLAMVSYAAWDYRRISQLYVAPEDRLPEYAVGTMAKARQSWLFSGQVEFAELTTSTLTSDNALHVYQLAQELLHYSPEPRVIEMVIESATQLGLDQEAVAHLARYRAAFESSYVQWKQSSGVASKADQSASQASVPRN